MFLLICLPLAIYCIYDKEVEIIGLKIVLILKSEVRFMLSEI